MGTIQDLNRLIARNLKDIRDQRSISLDRLAELSGVSKSMLHQIEKGTSSPTITTVWKIATGLGVPFTSLMREQQPDIVVVRKDEVTPLVEDNGRYHLFPYFPSEEGRSFEIYSVEIGPGGYLGSLGHGTGTEEYITVFTGGITVRTDGSEYTIKTGDAIRFKAEGPHAYHNSGDTTATLGMVIHYGQ